MATRYTATVWPPISFPLPTQFGRNGGTARPPTAPGATLPTATSLGRNGGFFRPPAAPPKQLPSVAASGRMTFTPAALPTTQRQTAYVKSFTTQQTTNTIFKIVNGSNVVTNPYPLA